MSTCISKNYYFIYKSHIRVVIYPFSVFLIIILFYINVKMVTVKNTLERKLGEDFNILIVYRNVCTHIKKYITRKTVY